MPSAETLLAFLIAASLFAYVPGPSMLYTTAQTLVRGQRAGWMAALGIHVGGYVHVLAAAFGVAILFSLVPVLFTVMKLVGAAYLVWLGLQMILSRLDSDAGDTLSSAAGPTSAWARFWDSALVEILNPKTALFYLAFLPQFVDPAGALPIWLQLLVLGTVVNLMFSSADAICVVLAAQIHRTLGQNKAPSRWIKRLGGAVLIALGLRLAFSQR